jgi:hypothetical protein
MTRFTWLALPLAGLLLLAFLATPPLPACCPAPHFHQAVVNADQNVIIVWDAVTQTQHFIRQATFKSDDDDFGFLIPSPGEPQLEESGNDAFAHLLKVTEPEVEKKPRPAEGINCTCSATQLAGAHLGDPPVRILQEKLVAGFNAVVLETKSGSALVDWLKQNGYAFSPEVEAWAKPYVEGGWKITALKVAKGKDGKADKTVAASALRMSFRTARPLFPYREPDTKTAAGQLGATRRTLRIYFLAEARYQGELTKEVPWTGRVAWANKLGAADRKLALELLKLPAAALPADAWLTEFEDEWPYRVAPADVYFSRAVDQSTVKRPPVIVYTAAPWPTDVMVYAIAAALILPPVVYRVRRGRKA